MRGYEANCTQYLKQILPTCLFSWRRAKHCSKRRYHTDSFFKSQHSYTRGFTHGFTRMFTIYKLILILPFQKQSLYIFQERIPTLLRWLFNNQSLTMLHWKNLQIMQNKSINNTNWQELFNKVVASPTGRHFVYQLSSKI